MKSYSKLSLSDNDEVTTKEVDDTKTYIARQGKRLVGLGRTTVFLKPDEYVSCHTDNKLETTYYQVDKDFNIKDCFEGICFVWPRNMIELTYEEAHTPPFPYDTK